ncbi:MAG: hypothetical protein CMK07_13105 [Ponticaulis sp.]|nr:hypothetical protein [Ponticaulis sp.]
MSETSSSEHQHKPDMDSYPGDKIFGWTSHPKAGFITFIAMIVICAALALASFVLPARHEYLHFAEFPIFYALYGFGAFAFVVMTGWPLRKLLGRPENYYGDEEDSDV